MLSNRCVIGFLNTGGKGVHGNLTSLRDVRRVFVWNNNNSSSSSSSSCETMRRSQGVVVRASSSSSSDENTNSGRAILNKVLKLLREEKSRDFTILLARPGGPDGPLNHRGNVTIQTDFHGPKRTRGEISDDVAKVRSNERYRERRGDCETPHVFRNARELFLWRLLQERGVRVGVGTERERTRDR